MSKPQIGCPVCGSPMKKRLILDNLEIDYCDLHGVWFDSGELERMMSIYDNPARPSKLHGVGKAVAQGFAGATVMGAGFHLGSRLVGGILDGMFNRRG